MAFYLFTNAQRDYHLSSTYRIVTANEIKGNEGSTFVSINEELKD